MILTKYHNEQLSKDQQQTKSFDRANNILRKNHMFSSIMATLSDFKVQSIIITNQGSGYSSALAISFTGVVVLVLLLLLI
jgi:hypothetical protein